MKYAGSLVFGLLLGLAAASILAAPSGAEELRAHAIIINTNGERVGTASLVETAAGDVRVSMSVSGVTPGEHGFHVHAVGLCDPTAFASAGAHFNPQGHQHGLQTSAGPHAGDMPNLLVKSDGTATFDMTVSRFTLRAGNASILDADRSALIIHADRDDGITDPTGNSGARVACGVITPGALPAASTSPAVSVGGNPSVSPPRTGDGGLQSFGGSTPADDTFWILIILAVPLSLVVRQRRKARAS
jgi:superoxide dismutase, Cu-Zn family